MSDTSIIASDSSKYDYTYEKEKNDYHNKDNCWNRSGANICVVILALCTILLSVALILVIFGPFNVQQNRKTKAQKPVKTTASVNAGKQIFGQIINHLKPVPHTHHSSDDDEADDSNQSDEQSEANEYDNNDETLVDGDE